MPILAIGPQIDRGHGNPEQIQVSLKELVLHQSDNPQPILPQYRPMQVANVFNVFLHLTLALAGIGIGYGLAVDWRIGR